jgi:hypothetical protein
MTQNDFIIDSDTAYEVRLDIQNAFQALASNSSGTGQPSTRYAGQWWYETDSNIMKFRNEANSAWIDSFYIDDGAGAFRIIDDTQVVNKTTGAQTGLLGDQTNATWEAGTGTTESLVSPAKVKAAIEALVPEASPSIGESQQWYAASSVTTGVSVQNTYGRAIEVYTEIISSFENTTYNFQVSTNNSTWITLLSVQADGGGGSDKKNGTFIIPAGHYFRYNRFGGNNTTHSYNLLR